MASPPVAASRRGGRAVKRIMTALRSLYRKRCFGASPGKKSKRSGPADSFAPRADGAAAALKNREFLYEPYFDSPERFIYHRITRRLEFAERGRFIEQREIHRQSDRGKKDPSAHSEAGRRGSGHLGQDLFQVGDGSFPKLKIPHQSHADFCSTDTAGGLDNKKRRYAPRGGVAYRLFLWGFPKGATPPFGTRLCEAKCSVLYALPALP